VAVEPGGTCLLGLAGGLPAARKVSEHVGCVPLKLIQRKGVAGLSKGLSAWDDADVAERSL
jgi:hypothetical protein